MAAPPAEVSTAALHERLRSNLSLLRAESGILDRVVYKGKNQHRRCSYFQSLLKVRRDVKLLLSAGVEDVLNNLFRLIDAKESERRLHMLEQMKKKNSCGKYNFHDRLLGIARLLSEMTESLLVTAVQISALFARSFFMSYSLIILSLLARMRVLLQQVLLDSVTVYNMITNLLQKKHAIKLINGGVEVYREYHPPIQEFPSLKCVWEGDKFILHEEVDNKLTKKVDNSIVEPSLSEIPAILYDILEAPTDGLGPSTPKVDDSNPKILEEQLDICSKVTQTTHQLVEHVSRDEQFSPLPIPNIPLVPEIDIKKVMELPNEQNAAGSKVAFLSVRKVSTSITDERRPEKKARLQPKLEDNPPVADESEDPFFKLLTSGLKRKLL